MKITVESEFELTDLSSQIDLLTNTAEFNVSTIKIDDLNKVIEIPMWRKHYVRKKRFLGLGVDLQLQSNNSIQSQLIIRDYVSYTIVNPLHLEQITILFGASVKNKEVYLCSVEESHGQVFELSVKFLRYNLELEDLIAEDTVV